MLLKDKAAIVTGGARGIGRETALVFARAGAKVVVADFDKEAGEKTSGDINTSGGRAIFIQVDVTDRDNVRAMVEETKGRFGKIDILVNNAGITADAMLLKMTEAQWDRVIGVNLKGVFNCTQLVAPAMIEQGGGVILNASSVVGVFGNIGQTNYAATKSGVIGMTKSWAKELGRKGIRVNAVAPGFIISDMTAKVPEKLLGVMKEKTALNRLGEVQDVAHTYLFLASDYASYITGQVLGVDGGLVV
ncbi:3-oxoacyl-ACP reductase FabG [Desulfosporosinus sp. PR]|uniref:3-oxoacyl-ACP reductase FabG n=1 Tax=Candidatus Desulfosporosinus nitrosoreducens TaxID=3401928 RepID=UPI0027E99019|nr:3-oxoacyl-ACP reductase FabG [Desulfosporosinus sp. PR]MDQ7093220.1 3-oxoacyl-ACP reductase FabG [Desulfosporosinus sp. PR]